MPLKSQSTVSQSTLLPTLFWPYSYWDHIHNESWAHWVSGASLSELQGRSWWNTTNFKMFVFGSVFGIGMKYTVLWCYVLLKQMHSRWWWVVYLHAFICLVMFFICYYRSFLQHINGDSLLADDVVSKDKVRQNLSLLCSVSYEKQDITYSMRCIYLKIKVLVDFFTP